MANRAHSTVVVFPERGGSGFRVNPNSRWGDHDQSNIYSFCWVREARALRERRETINEVDPALILGAMIMRRLSTGERASILRDVAMLRRCGAEVMDEIARGIEAEATARTLP